MTEPNETKPLTPWHGNWKFRLQEKLTLLGFATLEEFLQANPGLGYLGLAKLLSDANLAAMQLYGEQISRGFQSNNLRNAAMDCLVRFLNEYIPRGWKNGRHFQNRSAAVFSSWSPSISAITGLNSHVGQKLKKVFDILETLPIPMGWLPKDMSDHFVIESFEKGWPIAG